ncbi:MAG: flagellar hook basal-body protein [Polyangiaceae bacterium]|nr:flagellar hook basal-body protein [Polyangiaceae bacterium]
MSLGIWAAASGAVAEIADLEVTANNLANAGTVGFRGERSAFRQTLASVQRAGGAAGYRRYATLRTTTADLAPGGVVSTGRGLDVAFDGRGLFVVRTPAGDRYTRSGALRVSPTGELTTPEGHPYLGTNRRAISIPRDAASVEVAADGRVMADGQEVAQLLTVEEPPPGGLVKEGGALLALAPNQAPLRAQAALLTTGALEGSNVSVVRGMTDIITASRSLDALQRVIEAFREAEQRAASGIMGT